MDREGIEGGKGGVKMPQRGRGVKDDPREFNPGARSAENARARQEAKGPPSGRS